MIPLTRTAIGSAVALSVFSVMEAVVGAVHPDGLPWNIDLEQPWITNPWGIAIAALVAVTYLALAGVLVVHAPAVDGPSRVRRWTRRVLVAALTVVVLSFLVALGTGQTSVIAVLAGSGFAALFVGSVVLGVTLLRRRGMRLPAVLLAVVLPGTIVGVIVLGSIAPTWAHPAYPETVAYLGLALIGWAAERTPDPASTATQRTQATA